MPPSICLNMIVKDEAPIIERCLASVLPIIDHYVIADTGSTDGTDELVEAFFARHGVPGSVHSIQFDDFETARNRALERCRAADAPFAYVLLADADMELQLEQADWPGSLGQPTYSMRQTNGLSYYNTRLLRRDVPAQYVGVTHEYLHVEGTVARLDGAWFLDHACGSSRSEKLERDLRLLEAGLEREPGNARYMFYLAQTLKDAGRFDDAVTWYTRRIEAAGWSEEAWYARYMRAVCHQQMGEAAAFVQGCLEAYSQRPTRAEPLHALAKHFREAGEHEACLLLCEAGDRIAYPAGDQLFIDRMVYATGFREEASIAGYYCAAPERRARARTACLALATDRAAAPGTRAVARRNAMYYARSASETFGDCTAKEIRLEIDAPYRITNPSICLHDGRLFGVLRAVNYILQGQTYTILDPEQTVRTTNHFVSFDQAFHVAESRPMTDRVTTLPRFPVTVRGFEDCRLFRWRDGWWCSASVSDTNPNRQVEIAVLALNTVGEIESAHVNRTIQPQLPQKNWVPVVDETALRFVYSTDPTTIVRFDADTGQFEQLQCEPCGLALDHCRGGSQAVPIDDGWLYVTHEAIDGVRPTRVYLHRFVQLDAGLRVVAITDPFFFLHRGIEFAAGLVHDRPGRRLIVSFGAADARAYLAILDLAAVTDRLVPIPVSDH